jgi:hypothetical protein
LPQSVLREVWSFFGGVHHVAPECMFCLRGNRDLGYLPGPYDPRPRSSRKTRRRRSTAARFRIRIQPLLAVRIAASLLLLNLSLAVSWRKPLNLSCRHHGRQHCHRESSRHRRTAVNG